MRGERRERREKLNGVGVVLLHTRHGLMDNARTHAQDARTQCVRRKSKGRVR